MTSMTATEASGLWNLATQARRHPTNGEMRGVEMEKEKDHLRIAGLLLMMVDDDAAAAIEHIETGRAGLAKEFIAHIAANVKKAQENLRAAGVK